MIKNIQLSIPEPCHQNWQQMTPQEQGRFCKACAKVVVDFSVMSDKEILDYVSTASEKICGRVHEDQLDRVLLCEKNKNRRWLRYWVNLSIFFMMFFPKASSQVKKLNSNIEILPPKLDPVRDFSGSELSSCIRVGGIDLSNSTKKKTSIKGIVTDEKGEPIPGASVLIKGTRIGVAADKNGEFILETKGKKSTILKFSAVGFEAAEIYVENKTERNSVVHVQMKMLSMISGEVIVVGQKRRKNIFSILKKNESKCTSGRVVQVMKIYPNPVAPGGSFNINLAGVLPGNYSIFIYDASGRIILQRGIHINKGAAVKESFPCDERFRGGMYLAEISGVGKTYRQQFVVQ